MPPSANSGTLTSGTPGPGSPQAFRSATVELAHISHYLSRDDLRMVDLGIGHHSSVTCNPGNPLASFSSRQRAFEDEEGAGADQCKAHHVIRA